MGESWWYHAPPDAPPTRLDVHGTPSPTVAWCQVGTCLTGLPCDEHNRAVDSRNLAAYLSIGFVRRVGGRTWEGCWEARWPFTAVFADAFTGAASTRWKREGDLINLGCIAQH